MFCNWAHLLTKCDLQCDLQLGALEEQIRKYKIASMGADNSFKSDLMR